ncbi:MAG: tyrosine-type recombinase/integrase [Bacteroidota bacterium]
MKSPVEENIHVHTMRHGEIERRVGDFISSLHPHQVETRGTYNRALREFLRWISADGEFRFGSEDVERYRKYLAVERSLAGASVTTYLTALRSFCKYLVETGTLVENPVRSMRDSSTPAVQPRPVIAGEDADRLISMIPQTGELGSRDYAIVLLMLRCGLSETEIVRADINDYGIDSSGATMRVQKKGRRKKDAVVTIPSEVRRAMEEYLSRRVLGEGDTPLFRSAGNRTRGMRMTTRGIRSRVNEYIEAAGIKQKQSQRITVGSLRYAMPSIYFNN